MGLFQNNPYSNLHELNLDWVISKLKDVDKAQTAAQDVVALVDRAELAAGNAENSAESAATDAASAHDDAVTSSAAVTTTGGNVNTCNLAVQKCLEYKNDAYSYAGDAGNSADLAQQSANNANNYKNAASGYADSASDSADAAADSAADAAADADRAQLYGASTGVMCFNADVSAQSAVDIPAGYGTYAFIYFCDNTANSSGLHMIRHKSGNFKNRNLLTNGGAAMPVSLTQSGTDVHVYAGIADGTMYFILIGYAD